jgi:hypothetical protein
MALLTQTATQIAQNVVISMGSVKVLRLPLTTTSTSDTFNIGTGAPVIWADVEGESTAAGTSYAGDATYSSTTGLITMCSASQGSVTLVIGMLS